VMTRVHGEPLDIFLEQRRKFHESSVEGGGTGALGWCGPQPLSRQFDEACFFARELLVQLAPGFEHISSVTLHRDVNSHNILIDGANDPTMPLSQTTPPRFGLVDFGLAVDAMCWCNEEGASPSIARPSRIGQDGSSTWHYLDVGGDCRYWPLAAWVQFLAGWREIALCPSLCFEYQMRLDLHALGITALQLLSELLPLPPEVINGVRSAEILEGALEIGDNVWDDAPPELLVLRIVWERYWARVSPLHARLISTFHSGGDWDALKVDCIQNAVHDKIAEDLRMLRASIREVRDACQRSAAQASIDAETNTPSSAGTVSLASATGLFDALLLLVSDGHSAETTPGPEVWREVVEVLKPPATNTSTISSRALSAAGIASKAAPARLGRSSSARRETPVRRESPSRNSGPVRDTSRTRNGISLKARETSLPQSKSASRTSTPITTRRTSRTEAVAPLSGNGRNRSARSTSQSERTAQAQEAATSATAATAALAEAAGQQPQPENLSRRLHDLKSKVAWLSQEMAKLGEKGEVVGRRGPARASVGEAGPSRQAAKNGNA